MRIVLVDSTYPGLLDQLESFRVPNRGERPVDLAQKLLSKSFGAFPAYKEALEKLGHSVWLITPNQMDAQLAWARDQKLRLFFISKIFFRRWEVFSRIPLFGHFLQPLLPVGKILESQIKRIEPDLVLVGDLSLLSASQVARVKRATGAKLVGQIASPLPSRWHYKSYDLIVSAHPGIVKRLIHVGVPSRFLPLAFKLPANAPRPLAFTERRPVVAFVGSFGRHHRQNYPLLRAIAEKTNLLEIYGNPKSSLLKKYGLASFYRGSAFGVDMFKVLGEVAVGINRHAKFADGFAVNMRMYEVAGSGAVLVTEEASNLHDIFSPGSVVAYSTFDEAADKVQALLSDPIEAESIADSGRIEVLRRHSYEHRVLELLKYVEALNSSYTEP